MNLCNAKRNKKTDEWNFSASIESMFGECTIRTHSLNTMRAAGLYDNGEMVFSAVYIWNERHGINNLSDGWKSHVCMWPWKIDQFEIESATRPFAYLHIKLIGVQCIRNTDWM